MTITRRQWLFFSLVMLIMACDFCLIHLPYRTSTDLETVDFGVAMDFMLVIPFVYYMVLVRKNQRHWTSVIYVSFFFGHALLWFLHSPGLRLLIYPVDLLFVIVEIRLLMRLFRVGSTYRQMRHSSDVPGIEVFESALTVHLGSNPFFRYIATDLTLIYYSLFSWGRKAYSPSGTKVFSYHTTSNAWIILIVMSKVLLLEGFATHILVQHWSHFAAWVLTASNIYLWLFLLGDYRAMKLNPLILSDSALRVRYGLRFKLTIPMTDIAAVTETSNVRLTRKERRETLMYESNVHIALNHPVLARGPFGLQKSVTGLYIHLDQPGNFVRCVSNLKDQANPEDRQ
ncbi:hypothetical protein [Alicyclobacillus sp. SO9]|uniref:hypothetical protein n=1 Tax=Alicyclobacillus sp. SO9 TaxID=2665646 RepID=UPI0018E6FA70|nr:hypothetical protein [Alicyclobacillus sp. SO9]QQE77861.1 hypothetical protein GI364_18370 [Alicyclobacillus sp. SO9]